MGVVRIDEIGSKRSVLFGGQERLNDGVHLVHVGADPHDPHTDGADEDGDHSHSALRGEYWRLAETAGGGLFMPM